MDHPLSGRGGRFATLPLTNLFHVFTSPVNIFVAPFRVKGALKPIANLETAEQLGVKKMADLPWPRLVNVDACTECGRCQAVCPAYAAHQPLSPKKLVLDLRGALTGGAGSTATRGTGRTGTSGEQRGATGSSGTSSDAASPRPPVPVSCNWSAKSSTRNLWSCTTCYACVYECPVLIEQVDDIVDMRRYLALMEGDIPSSLAATLTNIERAGNPWKQPKRKRAAWAQGLDFEVPIMASLEEGAGVDVLWWVGCAGAYDPRNQKVTKAIAKILRAAGVNFAILGEEETCTGDSARRAGNEYLFQQLAQQNIETLNGYKFKLILTQCPHCLNTLLNEYPQFGGHYQVMHHTQYIEALLAEGQIKVKAEAKDKLTFHDPCYLGRYNDEYVAPRRLAAATGMTLVEMARSKGQAMCCGGGGARVWMEDEGSDRVNYNRLAQIQETGCKQVGVACPFCMVMLEDARGAKGAEDLVVRDVAEIVADALIT